MQPWYAPLAFSPLSALCRVCHTLDCNKQYWAGSDLGRSKQRFHQCMKAMQFSSSADAQPSFDACLQEADQGEDEEDLTVTHRNHLRFFGIRWRYWRMSIAVLISVCFAVAGILLHDKAKNLVTLSSKHFALSSSWSWLHRSFLIVTMARLMQSFLLMETSTSCLLSCLDPCKQQRSSEVLPTCI